MACQCQARYWYFSLDPQASCWPLGSLCTQAMLLSTLHYNTQSSSSACLRSAVFSPALPQDTTIHKWAWGSSPPNACAFVHTHTHIYAPPWSELGSLTPRCIVAAFCSVVLALSLHNLPGTPVVFLTIHYFLNEKPLLKRIEIILLSSKKFKAKFLNLTSCLSYNEPYGSLFLWSLCTIIQLGQCERRGII